MNESMTVRQTACICALSLIALKLCSLPSLLSKLGGTSAIIITIFMFFVDILILFIFLKAKEKYPKYSLYELLQKYLGKIVAKIIYLLIYAIFFCKLSVLINEGVVYMKNVVDEEYRIIIFLFTFLPVVTAMVYGGLTSTARTCEFGYVFVLVGIVACLFLAKIDLEFGELGPVLKNGVIGVIKPAFECSFWFTDFLFVAILSDKIKLQKNFKRTILFFVTIIALLMTLFYTVYFRLFRETGYIHETAIANITQYKKNIGNVGNADVIESLVYLFTIYLQGSIYLTCICNIFGKVTNDNSKIHALIVANGVIIITQCVVLYNLEQLIVFSYEVLKYSTILVWGIIPLFYLLLFIFDRGKDVKTYKRKNKTSKT